MKKILLLTITICLSSISFGQVPSYVPTDSLVGWWPFNGNANDESGNGNNGTVNGATLTTDRYGNANNAYDFDGIDDFINIGNLIEINGVSEMTWSAWVNPSNISLENAVISKRSIDTQNDYMALYLTNYNCNSNSVRNSIASSSVSPNHTHSGGSLDSVLSPNNLYHIAMVFNGAANTNSEKLKLYLNGVLQTLDYRNNSSCSSTLIPSLTPINNIDVYFGAASPGSFPALGTSWFEGKIDDIGIWNRALDSCEILNLYNSSLGCGCSPTTATDTQSACDSYTWIDGNTYTASNNTATYTLTNALGCDSVVTLDLTINSATVDAGNDQTVCLGCADIPDDSATLIATGAQSYSWDNGVTNGVAFLPSTTSLYTVTGTDANGCTATDTVTVFVGNRDCASFTLTGLDSVVYNNQTYYQTTLDTVIYTNVSGCDSIEYLDIIINHTGIGENILKEVEVYPNPTSDIITLKGINSLTDVSYIHLLDNKGAIIKKIGINETQVDLSSLSTGIYFIEIKHQLGSGRIKVIKQ